MGLFKKWAERIAGIDSKNDEIDDNQTTDLYLRSLRRQRRRQMEEFEKEKLLKDIKAHEKMRTSQAVLGVKHHDPTELMQKKNIKKRLELLKAKKSLITKQKQKSFFFNKKSI